LVHTLRSRSKNSLKHPAHDINGHAVHNQILLALPANERVVIFSKLQFVSLPVSTVLNEVGLPIKHVFFMDEGLASILTTVAGGKSVEVGLCGTEGFIGLPLTVGFSSSPTRIIIQVAGSGFRMSAKDFSAALRKCPSLAAALQRFALQLNLQSSQGAACNRLHEVEERLARWLLMSQDRLSGDFVPLTQDFLAHMLGTRRASVTVAAGILQKAGLITYARGKLKVQNRAKLEDAACECYELITKQIKKWDSETV
jgi:CRP-like cAMP-binding protein